MSQNFRYSPRRDGPPALGAYGGEDLDVVAALSDLEDDDEEEEEEDDDEEEAEEEEDEDLDEEGEEEGEDDDLPYPGFVAISLKYLDQKSKPRNWCLAMITSPYPFILKQS
ncbi:hypothetical protein LSTR_LSTR002627 [Laodelphax striatellus]|uniref:Voltage-dependent T-type calcium channel subunit alpha-1G n=1 Tax=Laodelphax striatellus TaxID=195883 RepID=A0A482XM57_LAOST|nr:hypothetical protein LSTR_LSTR002627 [Laodelphax striatellus]